MLVRLCRNINGVPGARFRTELMGFSRRAVKT
jgi:hypothetical protein